MNSDVLGPGLQNNWQLCSKCQGMAFAGNAALGECPAGGLHNHTGSGNYCLPLNGSVPPGSQDNWCWCNKCQVLSFAGGASLGKCSGGGTHNHAGSGNYVLATRGAGDVPQDSQDNWRWCKKCQVLAFAGNTEVGTCAEGGGHDHAGRGNYMARYVVNADTVLYEAYMKALKPKSG